MKRENEIGKIIVRFFEKYPNSYKLTTHFVPKDDSYNELIFYSHLYPGLALTNAYLTILESFDYADGSKRRYIEKVNFHKKIGDVWIKPGDGFGDDGFSYYYLRRGDRLVVSDGDTVVIEYVNKDSLIVRDPQKPDVLCYLDTPYVPFSTREMPRSDWIGLDGRSVFQRPSIGDC